ncbi:MAG: hypothetical protein ABSC92_17325 [Rhizomicrobium sp.]|jgi:hypothetical protein
MTVSDTDFRLSRLYAEGWNVANKLSSEESAEFDLEKMGALNPYPREPERAKWNEGFTAFMRKNIDAWGDK